MPKRGAKPKDKSITDNFNVKKRGGLTRKDELHALMEHERQEHEIAVLKDQVKTIKEKTGFVDTELEDCADDAKSAFQMLQDMRYAYRTALGPKKTKGRKRLVELMESDTEFKFIIKELMKIESSLKQAEIKGKSGGIGGSNNQNFFVVLKGLETVDSVMQMAGQGNVNEIIDTKQIEHAINPSESGHYEEEEERYNAEPAQLMKAVGDEQAPVEDAVIEAGEPRVVILNEEAICRVEVESQGGVDGW